jgi:alpha-L-fucosidase
MCQKRLYISLAGVIMPVLFMLAHLTGCAQTKMSLRIVVPDAEKFIQEHDRRMSWWREARFGMFIHWGLYAVPAGEWKGTTNHAEWILTTAQIPVNEYEKFSPQFNPVKFNAKEWVRIAKEAGMKYIVITSKHHDGFCLWNSKLTEYDIIDATPFKRDILRELTRECKRQGIRMCFYHSIMDWHHPDYLPRRGWEKRSSEGADFSRYVSYMKGQVAEIIQGYSPGVLWFDGEWESTWDADLGDDLYAYVRSLQSDIIVNNRVSKGRAGMAGTYDPKKFAGDFGTPEQEIPATGLGYDWETCMTMNDHWGYNKHDDNWKSREELIRKLIDIASKGGNFLLNVGPKADGTFPQPSIERLKAMGEWMKINGESVYGTSASLFENLPWGRSTTKPRKLYLHVFDWPKDGRLEVPGLLTRAESVYFLAEPKKQLATSYGEGSTFVSVPAEGIDPVATVIVMEFDREPEIVRAPEIVGDDEMFCGLCKVKLKSNLDNVKIRYTLDGSSPAYHSPLYLGPIQIKQTMTVKCQLFRSGKPISSIVERTFTKVEPREPDKWMSRKNVLNKMSGLRFAYYEGDWDSLPEFDPRDTVSLGFAEIFSISESKRKEYFGLIFEGYISIPAEGVYSFYLASDDGSRLWIGDELIVDNDGLHGVEEKSGSIALAEGFHPIKVGFFQKTGGADLAVFYSGPGIAKRQIEGSMLYYMSND